MSTFAQIIDFLLAGLEDQNGNPLSGGKIDSYNAGLLTRKDTYTVRDKSVVSTNPIPLDIYGRAVVYGDGLYKFVIKDAHDNTIKTVDNYNSLDTADHSESHENGGADEISVTGLSGLLADDQHVLDSEVLTALPFIDSRSYATLELANTAAYNAGKLLIIAQNYTLTANTTLTAAVKVIKGGGFTKASTYTLAFNGSTEIGLYQVFFGFSPGDVTFGVNSVKEVYPQWFGAKADGTTNDGPAIRLAGAVIDNSGGGILNLPDGIYLIDEIEHPDNATYHVCLMVYSNMMIKGNGVGRTIIKRGNNHTGTDSVLIWNRHPFAFTDINIGIRDLTVDGNAINQTGIDAQGGIGATRVWGARYENVQVKNVRGTAGSGSGEKMHFDFALSTQGYYVNCEAVCDSGSTATGFSVISSHIVQYVNCNSHSMSFGAGFTQWSGRNIKYVNCHSYLNKIAQFNSEEGGDILYSNCMGGGISPNVDLPDFNANTTLGETGYGIVLNNTIGAHILGGVFRYNASGISIINNSESITINGVDVSNSTYGIGASEHATPTTYIRNIIANNCTTQYSHPTLGYSPIHGGVVAPAVPATTVALTNPYPFMCSVNVYGGTVSNVALDGTALGMISGLFILDVGRTITLYYSVAPVWVWRSMV